jgi:uncharacterized protein (DUF488 family)
MHLPPRLYSVGHSTRTLPVFLELLRAHGIRGIADVRAIPASGRQPWFNRQPLSAALAESGFAYDWFGEELGGGRDDSPLPEVSGLKDPAYRGYAAHMATPAFAQGIDRLLALASRRPTAMMCAEAAPDGCHRLLLCDALHLRGVEVVHAIDTARTQRHTPHAALLARGTLPTYPPRQASLF